MKSPFDEVIDTYSNNLSRAVLYDKQNMEFMHNFMIWLIGFSIGALYLLASNFLGFKDVLSHYVLKSIVVLLSCSITFGILSRIALFFYQSIYNGNLFYIEGALSNKEMMTNAPEDVSDDINIENLIRLLKLDFGIDDSPMLTTYWQSSNTERQFILNSLKKKYYDMGVWASRSYKNAIDHVNTVMKTGLGFTDKELEALSKTSGSSIRRWRNASFLSVFLSCASFITSLIVLSIAY